MSELVVPIRAQTGAPVRIDGREMSAGPVISGGRVFFDKVAGTQLVLSEVAQMRMALDFRLQDGSHFDKMSAARVQALQIDWGTFTPAERRLAVRKARFVQKLDKVFPSHRRTAKTVIRAIIDGICNCWMVPLDKRPSVQSVRRWYRDYVIAGRDIRALVDCNWAKGNRGSRYDQWVIDTVQRVADDKRATPTPASYEVVKSLADEALRVEAAKLGVALELKGRNGTIGSNLIPRLVRGRGRYDLLIASTNMREAQRQAASVQLGPQGEAVNQQWEVDHTLLDIVVIDEDTGQVAGRPWMTTILDRYSRCIVGFSLSFAPPSWTSVMDALRVALARKDKIVAHMGGITNSWDCCGKPEVLITDRGRDFMSESLLQAARIVVFDLQHMKGRKPWLKGKIERWFRTIEEEVVHTLPGTTFANTKHREFYDSEGQAVLNIYELNWLVLKWIVDVYHHKRHSKLRRTPAQAWKDGLRDIPLPRGMPDELLIPMTGLVVSRTLRRDGIRFENLRWASDAFSALRRRPDIVDVQVRIDPLDLRTAYILDDVTNKWVEGYLVEPTQAIGMTLNQWRTIERVRKKIQDEEDMPKDQAIGQARAEMDAYVKEIRDGKLKSKASKRLAEFKSNTAWSKVRQSIASDVDSIPGSHIAGVTHIASPPIQPVGPFKDPVRKRATEPKTPPVTETEEESAGPPIETPVDEPVGAETAPDAAATATKTRKRRQPESSVSAPADAPAPAPDAQAPVSAAPPPDDDDDDYDDKDDGSVRIVGDDAGENS